MIDSESENGRYTRQIDRRPMSQVITVVNSVLNEKLGSIVNVHEEGFMLLGTGVVNEDCLYQLQFHLTAELDGKTAVSLGAECLWKKATGGGGQFWAGFHIIDIADEDKALLTHLGEQIQR